MYIQNILNTCNHAMVLFFFQTGKWNFYKLTASSMNIIVVTYELLSKVVD